MSDEFPPAPELPDHLPWLNVETPLSMHGELWGHVVLLCFWNASDTHSALALASLAKIATRFADRSVVVVGIHSAKFPADVDETAVREAVRRLDVRHPVLVDTDGHTWSDYECHAWPTLVVVDAEGRIRFHGAGEVDPDRLSRALEALLEDANLHGVLAGDYGLLEVTAEIPPDGPLLDPTKLAVDRASDTLWVADTGHHRLVALDLTTGEAKHVVGAGVAGMRDGGAEEARFRSPRGIAIDGGRLVVADTGNHLLRSVSLVDRTVGTLLGTGQPIADGHGGGCGRDQGISAPWDVCWYDGVLYVALAGCHQVWTFDRVTGAAVPWFGAGDPSFADGEIGAACVAQPLGLAVAGDWLAVVDGQASALRVVELSERRVHSPVGGGLFVFGDVDGAAAQARLQFPTDVCATPAGWVVADTANDKLRRLSTDGQVVETLLGPGDGLRRPEGVACHGETLFVSSTGTHRVLMVDLPSGASKELDPKGLAPPAMG